MPTVTGIVLSRSAEMICGDNPYAQNFPYRSSAELTRFFHDLWLDYAHDGSTRRYWVQSVLEELSHPRVNAQPDEQQKVLTEHLSQVIAYIVHPVHYHGDEEGHSTAIAELNDLLLHDRLQIVYDSVFKSTSVITMDGDLAVPPSGATAAGATPPGVLVSRPTVFKVPTSQPRSDQCGVLMPFTPLLNEIYEENLAPAIKASGFEPLRADEIWRDSVLVNDIFDLIYGSAVIIADLSGRNANVLYELGIAHTLGRPVVPIVQEPNDIPFDLRHHRYLQYDATQAGRHTLEQGIGERLKFLAPA